jgi:hypothetical protein
MSPEEFDIPDLKETIARLPHLAGELMEAASVIGAILEREPWLTELGMLNQSKLRQSARPTVSSGATGPIISRIWPRAERSRERRGGETADHRARP